MFTGIVQAVGHVVAITPKGGDVELLVDTATLGLLRVLSKNAELAGAQNEVIKRMKALAFSGRK